MVTQTRRHWQAGRIWWGLLNKIPRHRNSISHDTKCRGSEAGMSSSPQRTSKDKGVPDAGGVRVRVVAGGMLGRHPRLGKAIIGF